MFILVGLAIFPALCIAQLVPTAPGPWQTFTAGSKCTMEWQPDTTGTWEYVTIDLMSGSNKNMSFVTNVASGLDGTSSSSYTWTCPEVNPYSAIYFYQFNQKTVNTNPSPAWTTRFTISSPNGETTVPEHSMQPNGDPIPWGVGRLVSADAEEAFSSTSITNVPTSTPPIVNTVHPTTLTSAPVSSPSPEVTLNVPAPKPNKNARREGFSKVYREQSRARGVSRRNASASLPCKARRRNERRRL